MSKRSANELRQSRDNSHAIRSVSVALRRIAGKLRTKVFKSQRVAKPPRVPHALEDEDKDRHDEATHAVRLNRTSVRTFVLSNEGR